MTDTVTQVNHPWRATLRTALAAVIGFVLIAPIVVSLSGINTEGYVAAGLTVTAAITRLLASPVVNAFLTHFLPWFAAAAAEAKSVVGEDPNA